MDLPCFFLLHPLCAIQRDHYITVHYLTDYVSFFSLPCSLPLLFSILKSLQGILACHFLCQPLLYINYKLLYVCPPKSSACIKLGNYCALLKCPWPCDRQLLLKILNINSEPMKFIYNWKIATNP